MPRDVRTRWNSTYDMLEFALRYQTAIDDIAGNKAASLRRYELDGKEWEIAQQLCDTLKMRASALIGLLSACDNAAPGFEGSDAIFFTLDAKSCDCDSSNGSY
jgi:hypothetical protein